MIYKFILKVRHLYIGERVHRSTLYGFSKKTVISVILHTLYCKKRKRKERGED